MDTESVHTQDWHLRERIRRGIRLSPKSCEQICDALSARVGRTISPETLHKWKAESETERRLPADCLLALSEILGDDSLQRQMLGEHLRSALELGEWLLDSTWVVDKLSVKLGKLVGKSLKEARGTVSVSARKRP